MGVPHDLCSWFLVHYKFLAKKYCWTTVRYWTLGVWEWTGGGGLIVSVKSQV